MAGSLGSDAINLSDRFDRDCDRNHMKRSGLGLMNDRG
jgi:hypothetical protein